MCNDKQHNTTSLTLQSFQNKKSHYHAKEKGLKYNRPIILLSSKYVYHCVYLQETKSHLFFKYTDYEM